MSRTIADATHLNKQYDRINLLIYLLNIVITDYSKMLIFKAA